MDFTGASGAIPRNDRKRMDKHAGMYYEEIRKRSSDVASIAKNTEFSVEDVEKIKQHVFMNEYLLDGEIKKFDPDFDMALSWQRLIEGKDIREMDIAMLNHELHEFKLMSEGLDYRTAHDLTDWVYNYGKYTKELDAKEGII